jgi:hypothetical protein
LHKVWEKSAKNILFLGNFSKKWHYGPISQNKNYFFKYKFLKCGEGPHSPTTPNRDISCSMNFETFDPPKKIYLSHSGKWMQVAFSLSHSSTFTCTTPVKLYKFLAFPGVAQVNFFLVRSYGTSTQNLTLKNDWATQIK